MHFEALGFENTQTLEGNIRKLLDTFEFAIIIF